MMTNAKFLACVVLQIEFLVTIPLDHIIVFARSSFSNLLTEVWLVDPLEMSKTSKSLAIGSKQIGKKTMIYILLKLLMATNILKKQKRNLQ